jgi:hypothetical protein
MTATATSYVADRIVERYVDEIRSGPPQVAVDVIAEIADGGTEIIYELLAITADMGLRDGVESEDDCDAWWDAMEALLPRVVKALS